MANDAESAIYNKLTTAPTFKPSGVRLFTPDWTLEPGDVVTVQSDGVNYTVPIYSMNLEWRNATKVDIQSSGNQTREPLPALRRREYRSGRRGYSTALEVEETQQQYQHYVEETDAYKVEMYKVTGVEYDANGNIRYTQATDAQGNPIWETDEQGNYILDEDGNKIPVYAVDNAGNKIPIYNEQSDGSISAQIVKSAQKIGMVIEESNGVNKIRGGKIILAINQTKNAQSTVEAQIEADLVTIDGGTTTINDVLKIVNNKFQIDGVYTEFIGEQNKTVAIQNGAVSADVFTVQPGGHISFVAGQGDDGDKTLDYASVFKLLGVIGDGRVTGASVTNNVLTLTLKDTLGITSTVNFSKATDLKTTGTYTYETNSHTAGWNGGTFKVIATQTNKNTTTNQNETVAVALTSTRLVGIQQSGNITKNSTLPKYVNFPYKILYDDGDPESDGGDTGFRGPGTGNPIATVSVDASLVYEDGQKSVDPTWVNDGWRWSGTEGNETLGNAILSANPYNPSVYYHSTVVGLPSLDVNVTKNQAIVTAKDQGNVSGVVKTSSHTISVASTTIPSGSSYTELTSGDYALTYTKDGTSTPWAYYKVTGSQQQGTYAEGWGAAFQNVSWPTSGTSNAYIDVSAPIATVDGPADLRRFIIRNDDLNNDIAYISTLNSQNNTYTNYAMLNHGKYTAGQNSVTAVLTSATPPSGTTPSPLTNGTYGVFLSKGGVLDSTAVSYHSVTSGGSVTYVVSSNGEPIMVWNGLSVVGSLYPNTDVVVSSATDQLGRRQISYNSGTISRTGYVSSSVLSSTKGSTNYPGRIGWTDEGGSGASRSVTSLSNVILASTDTTTSTHTVDVTYDDGNTVTGGATVTVDASAISGGVNLGHRRFTTNNTYYATDFGLDGFSSVEIAVSGGSSGSGGVSGVSRYAQSDDSTDFSDWTFNDTKTQSQKYAFYKIAANDGTVFNFGVDASAVYTAGQQSGSGSNRTVSSLSSISLSRSDTGTSTKNTTVTYTSGSNSTASISVNASNVYQQGVDDGYAITTTEITAGNFQVQTGSTSGRTSAGSISAQSVYNARNSGYIFFTATCRGKTRNFYVTINA